MDNIDANSQAGIAPGQINADGNVDVADLFMMQQAVVGKITLTATQELHADVYQAGGTDSTIDVAYLSVLEGMVMASSRKDFGG